MNLATRRMTEQELQRWAETDRNRVLVFRVADRFGDYGLTGLASLTIEGATAHVSDFVMSCRVLGRGVEETLLYCLTEHARDLGAGDLVATCRPTARNAPCQEFFQSRSGFHSESGKGTFRWSLGTPYPLPGHIALHTLDHQAEAVGTAPPEAASL
jgi:FkbH-like protein